MSNEHNVLELLRIVVDEAAARIPLWELEKRQSKYPNAGWTQCSEEELKAFAKNSLEQGKYIDAMNYLAFAVALGYDY